MNIERAYDDWSSTYDSDPNFTRDLDAELMRRLHSGLRVESAIEAGCGTGKNTGFLADRAKSLMAFDMSREMLAIARAKVVAEHVQWRQQDLTQPWQVPPQSVDFISFNLVLEHIERLESALAEAAAACRPHGCVFLCELHPYRQYRGAQARFTSPDGTEVRIPAFLHHVSDYVSAANACGLLLADLGEWWHAEDHGAVPRLLTLQFTKR